MFIMACRATWILGSGCEAGVVAAAGGAGVVAGAGVGAGPESELEPGEQLLQLQLEQQLPVAALVASGIDDTGQLLGGLVFIFQDGPLLVIISWRSSCSGYVGSFLLLDRGLLAHNFDKLLLLWSWLLLRSLLFGVLGFFLLLSWLLIILG